MTRRLLISFCLLTTPYCWADIDAQLIALNCRNCHNPQAEAAALTTLDQLSATQIRNSLLNFKYDKQSATLMPRLAKGYTDQELSAVADYLGKH